MRTPHIRLKNFFFVILGFSTMTMLCLNVLSSIPTQEAAAPTLHHDGETLWSARRFNDELQRATKNKKKNKKTWKPWLLTLYKIGNTILQQLPNNLPGIYEEKFPCQKLRLWPTGINETEDRILDQLRYTLPHITNHTSSPTNKVDNSTKGTGRQRLKNNKMKTILVFTGLGQTERGQQRFLDDQCPINSCYLTDNHSYGPIADVVLFQNHFVIPAFKRPLNQIWVMFLLESPLNTQHFQHLKNLINMTATYRIDSTIVTPYERFVPFKNVTQYQMLPPKKNYASGKNRKIAWFVSNCHTTNNRLNYALELSKYISVDIYGYCGKFKCPKTQPKKCYEKLNTDYKFYLAFENSNCKDYITEKLYRNGLLNDILPIVMGARPEDYAKVAPPNSYIHVDEFESPKQLASYLHVLDQNDELYNDYFRWKGLGYYINTKFYCRLCTMVSDNTRSSWYEDLETWWRGPGICLISSSSNKYASWKRESQFSYYNISRATVSKQFDPHYINVPSSISSSLSSEQNCK